MRMIDAIDRSELRGTIQWWRDAHADVDDADCVDILDDVLLLIDAQSTLTPPNEWVSVEERLPEEKQRVIVRCERVGTSVGWILWGNWMTDIGPDAGKVTHWMPLPAPPDRRPPERQEDNNETD